MKNLIAIPALFWVVSVSFAQEITTFNINDTAGRDVITFTSTAPLETIVGQTGEIIGYVKVNLADIFDSPEARFEVDLPSLKTGIAMRDEHMRDKYLETGKFPKTTFELLKIENSSMKSLENDKDVEVTVLGNFTVHGVTRPINVVLTVTYKQESEETQAKSRGDLLHITGSFDILLADYEIKRPQFLLLKLNEKQVVKIDVFASTAFPAPQLSTVQ